MTEFGAWCPGEYPFDTHPTRDYNLRRQPNENINAQ
jgi:hypothetical protein